MKYTLLIASMAIVLAGCDQVSQPAEVSPVQQTADSVPSVTSAPATVTPDPATQPCADVSGYQVMPAGMTLEIPYHVRADIITKDEAGQRHRHIVLEYLEGNLDATITAIERSLASGGYVPRPRRKTDDGRFIVPFLKKGHQNIIAVFDPSPGNKPSNPEAKGTVTLQYPMEGMSIPPAATKSSGKAN